MMDESDGTGSRRIFPLRRYGVRELTRAEKTKFAESCAKLMTEGIGTAAAMGAGMGAIGGAVSGAIDHFKTKKSGGDSSFLKSVGKGALKGAAFGAGTGAIGSVISNAVGHMAGSAGGSAIDPSLTVDKVTNDGTSGVNNLLKGDNGFKFPDVFKTNPSGTGSSGTYTTTGDFKSTDDYLKHYYGDKAGEIEKNAVTNRFGGTPQSSDHRVFNTTTSVAGDHPEFDPSRPDPMKHIRATNGRSNARMGTGTNEVNIDPSGGGWDLENLERHEIGHTLNYNGNHNIGNNPNPDVTQAKGIGYQTGNNNEFGSFLGSVRRTAFKNSGGSVDTAKPADFQKVINDPNSYGLGDMDKDGVKQLKNLLDYNGTDKETLKRKGEISNMISDPKFMGQFVKSGESKTIRTMNSSAAA